MLFDEKTVNARRIPDKLVDKILWLTSSDYEVLIKPTFQYGWIEFQLTKDNHHVARIVEPEACSISNVWDSDEEWFIHTLTILERELEDYIRKNKGE